MALTFSERKKKCVSSPNRQSGVIITIPCRRQDVNIAKGIYLPPVFAFLSDLILVATKLLAYTSYLLQSLAHREWETDTVKHAGHRIAEQLYK